MTKNIYATQEELARTEGEIAVVYEARNYLECRSNLTKAEEKALEELEVRHEYLYAMKVGIERVQRGY